MNTWVIKIGSNILTSNSTSLNTSFIQNIAKEIKELKNNNIRVILVSSGSIVSGMGVCNFDTKPQNIHKLQALASIGQMDLMHTYENEFSKFDITTSQILLTNDNLTNKDRYNNIIGTINTLLEWDVVPIVNENDTVSTYEINFGDNDNLAALLSNLTMANKLVILTDQLGLYNKNPTKHPDAKLIDKISKSDALLTQYASKEGSSFGKGGMYSKVLAARLCQCDTYIISGNVSTALSDVMHGKSGGTYVYA